MAEAAQRGVQGTEQILTSLMEGLESEQPDWPVYVLDLVPSRCLAFCNQRAFGHSPRFNEWGRAVWGLQQKSLKGDSKVARQWRFAAYMNSEEASPADFETHIARLIHSEACLLPSCE